MVQTREGFIRIRWVIENEENKKKVTFLMNSKFITNM